MQDRLMGLSHSSDGPPQSLEDPEEAADVEAQLIFSAASARDNLLMEFVFIVANRRHLMAFKKI